MAMEIALGRQHRPQIFNRCCALMTSRPAPETACCVRPQDKTTLVTDSDCPRSCRPESRAALALTSHVTPFFARKLCTPSRFGRDHRMRGAKLRCITLATRRERTLRTAQITMTTRLGKRRLQLLPSTCCGGSAPTTDAIDTDDCSPAL